MGTEIAISFSNLRSQLENEKTRLCKIDESIKRIVQAPVRFFDDRYNEANSDSGKHLSTRNGTNNDENVFKKKGETKTVFSRLTNQGYMNDDSSLKPKRAKLSSTVSRELPSREEVLKAQGGDEAARGRNRRMFGSLLGTLQKFKQEEIVLQNKEEKKAQVERKIEEQAKQQREKELQERRTLFAQREHKKAIIKSLEMKMARVSEFEKFESSQRHLSHFICTKTSPTMYWLPRRMCHKAQELLADSKQKQEKILSDRRQQMEKELLIIELRCLRNTNNRTQDNLENGKEQQHNDESQEPMETNEPHEPPMTADDTNDDTICPET